MGIELHSSLLVYSSMLPPVLLTYMSTTVSVRDYDSFTTVFSVYTLSGFIYTSLFIVKHDSKIKEKVKQLGNKDYNAHIR